MDNRFTVIIRDNEGEIEETSLGADGFIMFLDDGSDACRIPCAGDVDKIIDTGWIDARIAYKFRHRSEI
jgi:hypothetical protein